MLTHTELCRAIAALGVIEDRGRADEFQFILNQATESSPSAEPWGNATSGEVIRGGLLARRLSNLLGVPVEQCEAAAVEVLAPGRQRAIFNAIVGYAKELKGEDRAEPSLLELYQRYGLDALLDFGPPLRPGENSPPPADDAPAYRPRPAVHSGPVEIIQGRRPGQ